jgi:predicted AlkP superfamily phosphohydrolase/phosphomutase
MRLKKLNLSKKNYLIMKFDPLEPLAYLHLFKTAGTSVEEIFTEHWFKNIARFRFHYHEGDQGLKEIVCTSEDIKEYHPKNPKRNKPLLYLGHFNPDGSYEWPKELNQFLTMLRDPFDIQVSAFYYYKRRNREIKEKTIEEYILNSDYEYSFTKVFTKEILTHENYKEVLGKYFLTIGSMKNYKKSLENFAEVLDKKVTEECLAVKRNVNPKGEDYFVPNQLREIHRQRFPLEYEIYDYVNNLYNY